VPLKLVPPRKDKSPNYRVRGTYLGQYVDRTARTPDKATARKVLAKIKRQIERGVFTNKAGPTFASAAVTYLKNGGDDRFLPPLKDHFGTTPLAEIDQAAIDEAADTLYPDASPATRNREVYTPVSAILKHVGVDFALKRPKGSAGAKRTRWLWPEQAFAVLQAATSIDREFGAFLTMLCYTGVRLEEGLALAIDLVRLSEGFAYVPNSKNDEPRPLYLPPIVVAALANHPRGLDRPGERVFRFSKNGHLYKLLKRAFTAAGVPRAKRDAFHVFRHTYGTWMRRYGGLDTKGLVGTGTWKDEKSAARYQHVVVSEEAEKALLLPTPRSAAKRELGGKSVETYRRRKKIMRWQQLARKG
jgi:integrase